jgi:flagellar biogenesis protein FliO
MEYSVDVVTAAVKMFGFLGLILGCLIAASLYMKRRSNLVPGSSHRKNLMRVVQRCPVGVKKSIIALEVPGAILLVGVGAEGMNLLARLEGEDADLGNLEKTGGSGYGTPFADQLKRTISVFRGARNPGLENRGGAE